MRIPWKKTIKLSVLCIISVFILFSCSKDEVASAAKSRDVKYEIPGDYSGQLTVVVTTNDDVAQLFEVNKLPWVLEFKAKDSIKSLSGLATGSTGKVGETATFKTYIGGKEVSSGKGTALSTGFINMSNLLISI